MRFQGICSELTWLALFHVMLSKGNQWVQIFKGASDLLVIFPQVANIPVMSGIAGVMQRGDAGPMQKRTNQNLFQNCSCACLSWPINPTLHRFVNDEKPFTKLFR